MFPHHHYPLLEAKNAIPHHLLYVVHAKTVLKIIFKGFFSLQNGLLFNAIKASFQCKMGLFSSFAIFVLLHTCVLYYNNMLCFSALCVARSKLTKNALLASLCIFLALSAPQNHANIVLSMPLCTFCRVGERKYEQQCWFSFLLAQHVLYGASAMPFKWRF